MQKFISICLALTLIFSLATVAFAEEKSNFGNTSNITEDVILTEENYEEIISDYNIPKEVSARIREIIADENWENTTLSIELPVTNKSGIAPASSSGSWGYGHYYNGYYVRDYVLTIKNAFAPQNITQSGRSAGQFFSQLVVTGAVTGVSYFYPFVGIATSLIDFINKMNNTHYTAGSGDKAYAAPKFLTYQTFTYVTVAGTELLGAETFATFLESIAWYFYSDSAHEQKTGIETFSPSKYYKSVNYDNRDAVAVKSYNNTVIDNPICITIGVHPFELY